MKRILVALALLGLVACGSDDTSGDAAGSTTSIGITPTGGGGAPNATTTTDLPFKGSAAPIATLDTAPATMTALDIGLHDGFERVVFRFSDHVPGIRMQPSPGPFAEDGSGTVVPVDGNAFLAVRLTANGHNQAGQPASAKRTRGPAGHSVTEVVRTGDFEGVLSYVIGLTGPQTYRVLQLSNPPRIAIDIASN